MVSGIIIMLLVSYIDYNFILRFSWLIYLGAIGLLGLVIVAGEQSKGAQRWFKIGGFQFQPSELVKILMILFLAYYFMRYEEKINSPRVLFGSFVLIGIPLALILAQPNLSTTIVLALVFAAMLFAAGLSYKIVVGVLAVCVPTFFIVLTLIIQDKFPFISQLSLGRIMVGILSGIISGYCLPAAELYHGDRFRPFVGKRTRQYRSYLRKKRQVYTRAAERLYFRRSGGRNGLCGNGHHYNSLAFHYD